jgi:hypothetical protein
MALDVIASASVLFYEASYEYIKDPRQAGQRFKNAIIDFYPLTDDDPRPILAADVLWTSVRNPLVHSFGVGKDRRAIPGAPRIRDKAVMVAKVPLNEERRTPSPKPASDPRASDQRSTAPTTNGSFTLSSWCGVWARCLGAYSPTRLRPARRTTSPSACLVTGNAAPSRLTAASSRGIDARSLRCVTPRLSLPPPRTQPRTELISSCVTGRT